MDKMTLQTDEKLPGIFTGALLFAQGYDALCRMRIKNVVRTLPRDAEKPHGHSLFIWLIVASIGISEFAYGLTLVSGLFSQWTHILLGLELLLISFAFSFTQLMWNTQPIYKRPALVLTVTPVPAKQNAYPIDNTIQQKFL